LPDSAVKHLRGFKPNGNEKYGFNALFSINAGIPFTPFIPKTRKIVSPDNKDFQKAFMYIFIFYLKNLIFYFLFSKIFRPNKIHQVSVFSPPMSSFVSNLKREFPKAFCRK
jgi:hypothetical protein